MIIPGSAGQEDRRGAQRLNFRSERVTPEPHRRQGEAAAAAHEEASVSVVSSKLPFAFHAFAAALVVSAAMMLPGCSRMGETNVHGIVVSETMLAQVKPGTPQQAVIEALGTPSTTSTINGEAFYYVSQTTSRPVAFLQPHVVDRTVLVIYFDDKGKVARVANYGLQDGVPFDTITRTTPTAGAEQNFITQLIRGLGAGIPGLSR
jgi:outer membrane protein assembly factor BamE (lipoprotein component of BamABCDE complex)